MLEVDLKPRARKFIEILPPKHKRQVKDRILALLENPNPSDSKKLLGYENYLRADIGEYRIIYRYSKTQVTVVLIGKRNDDEVYRIAQRILQ